jgi:hypothetical protein
MLMSVKFLKSENYCLVNDKIILDVQDGLNINKLKNLNKDSFFFDEENEIWIYRNYKSNIPLIKLLYPEEKIKGIDFKNDNINDYRRDNLVLTLDERFINQFNPPKGYEILESGESYKVTEGKFAGQYRNMYWKVKDSDSNTFYIMHIKDDIYTKFSKRDIKKVLDFNGVRPSWYLNQNGYIGSTIRYNNEVHNIYLHQLILDVHTEDLTDLEKTVDHINRNKLDNRRDNLRLVNMSIQNSNRDKSERRSDACDLPGGFTQKDLPKYVVYRKEFLDKEAGKYREYFYIDSHPKLEKRWETTKSMEVTLGEKLKLAKLKIQQIEGIIDEKEYLKQTSQDKKIDLPQYIRIAMERDKYHYIFEKREDGKRLGYRRVLKSTDVQKELDTFIDEVNKKYPDLKIAKYAIKNKVKINGKDVSESDENEQTNNEIKLTLPANFSFYKDTKSGYYFAFSKTINKERLTTKTKVSSNNIQTEFDKFIDDVNVKYPELKIPKYKIPDIPSDIKIIDEHKSSKNITETPVKVMAEQNIETNIVDNSNKQKPIMPTNFSICSVNNVDYIQFCKKCDGKRIQYKTKINSYDLQSELNDFIDKLNHNYKLGLVKSDYKIINTDGWKTTNKIVVHEDTDEKIANREKAQKHIQKKKAEIGEEEFKRQNNLKQKQFREKVKENEIEL